MKIRNSLYVALIVGASAVLAPVYGPSIAAHAASTTSQDDMERSVKSLLTVFSIVEQNYADPVSSEKAIYQGAIPGMLRTLDPHSNFLDPAEFQDMQRTQRANYSGIGMLISTDNGKVVAMEPFVGSPAWKADLRRGDVIAAVDGKDATKKDSAAVADMLRGPKDTQVKVTIKREGVADPITVTVVRGGIETSKVDAFWVKPGIAFLSVTTFEAQNVARDVEAGLQRLGEGKINGLILDLRENRGGLVTEAVSLAGRFLHDGQVVVSHHGRAEKEQVFRAKANAAAQKYPIVVMVNGNSASASEIVSGALQDHDRALIMGTNTFGKGLVQAQFPVSEGGALLLTIAHYYTPSGRLIQRDYTNRSFYDYYTSGGKDSQNLNDAKATDTGRKMYGGGGIAPDEKYEAVKSSILERRLNPLYTNTLFRFGNSYFGGVKPHLPDGWEPDDETMARFKDFLHTQQIPFTDADFNRDKAWLRNQVRFELYLRAFDKKTADRAAFMSDPELQRAIESLPKAQTLLSEAQKVLAQRQ
jgi:carboxyl-terminal processing protease